MKSQRCLTAGIGPPAADRGGWELRKADYYLSALGLREPGRKAQKSSAGQGLRLADTLQRRLQPLQGPGKVRPPFA